MDFKKPVKLGKFASEWWDKVTDELINRGTVNQEDEECLREMCICVQRMEKAHRELERGGYLTSYNGNENYTVSPWFSVWTKSAELYNRLANQFGMTPAARIKLKLEEKQADDEMRALLEDFDD